MTRGGHLKHLTCFTVALHCRSVYVFTALHAMQTRSSDENSVRPSVRLSVSLTNAWIVIKQKKDLSRFSYHTKDHLA